MTKLMKINDKIIKAGIKTIILQNKIKELLNKYTDETGIKIINITLEINDKKEENIKKNKEISSLFGLFLPKNYEKFNEGEYEIVNLNIDYNNEVFKKDEQDNEDNL